MNNMQVAQHTLGILEANEYYVGDKKVVLADDPQSLRAVVVYTPEMVANAISEAEESASSRTGEILVDMLDTLTSAKVNGQGKTAVLNFANAFHAGGGFLRGSWAQEEALCRCSSLYASITSPAASAMYDYNNAHVCVEGSDYMLLSPDVVVFRDGCCNLIEQPYKVTVISAAAPNLYGEARGLEEPYCSEVVSRKIKNVVAVAARNSCDTLILGAWGCGAFGHDSKDVAQCFYDVLVRQNYKRLFKRIVFSVYTRDPEDYNYVNFVEKFKF